MTALLLPIVQMVFLNLTIGLAPGYLHMGYVNDEVVKGVRECHPEALRGCHTDALLSCRILDRFNRNDKLIMVHLLSHCSFAFVFFLFLRIETLHSPLV